MYKYQINRHNFVTDGTIEKDGFITHHIIAVSGCDETQGKDGLIIFKRAPIDADLGDTYSHGRDSNGHLIMFYDRGEFIPA